ncbi:hypothetical protein FRB94_014437 [Tulasnella sp. JGI-2019a]|nr:hypothetical protein FRB94_014437 [Tulasnella sp. JGI-2019a]KAG9032157.1 hypothetical protein FRB95_001864 [Tulasnella sp. JGI-2019a]
MNDISHQLVESRVDPTGKLSGLTKGCLQQHGTILELKRHCLMAVKAFAPLRVGYPSPTFGLGHLGSGRQWDTVAKSAKENLMACLLHHFRHSPLHNNVRIRVAQRFHLYLC